FRDHGRRVVRTARAEIRAADRHISGLRQHALHVLQVPDLGREILVAAVVEEALSDADRDVVGIERTLDRKKPAALLVLLADADRLVGGAVKLLAYLHLDQRAFLLDHDDEIEAVGKFLQLALAQRPRAGNLVEADTEIIA